MRPFLAILILLLTTFLVLAILGPATIHFQREIRIAATKQRVFEEIQFLKNFNAWSPWTILDPQMNSTVAGVDGKEGATYTWDGNDQVGSGNMSIAQVIQDSSLVLHVKFFKPWSIEGDYQFLVSENIPDSTTLTWDFRIDVPFVQRPVMYFVNLEKSLSIDLESGLGNVRKNAEARRRKNY